jgi:hypothetical protein
MPTRRGQTIGCFRAKSRMTLWYESKQLLINPLLSSIASLRSILPSIFCVAAPLYRFKGWQL